MSKNILKEIIPVTTADCFTIFSRNKSTFDYPIHYHEEYELNFIKNAKGVKRVIGDHMEEIDDLELVLVGPNLQHVWTNNNCKSEKIFEVTIQFHKDLFDEKFLHRNQMSFIRKLFEISVRGILFSRETTIQLEERITGLDKKHGFDSVLELMSILHDLSISRNMRILSDASFNSNDTIYHSSRRVQRTIEYINQNFDKPIKLSEVSKLANMTESAFSRFFKARTGVSFVDCVNESRIGHASRMLIDTNQSVAEIAYHCGFNNISNFNRVFKKKKNLSPKDFRESYTAIGKRVFV